LGDRDHASVCRDFCFAGTSLKKPAPISLGVRREGEIKSIQYHHYHYHTATTILYCHQCAKLSAIAEWRYYAHVSQEEKQAVSKYPAASILINASIKIEYELLRIAALGT
jgi:hypothetical protein